MHFILFVDSENIPSSTVPAMVESFAKRNDTFEARVYGCKTSTGFPWKEAITKYGWSFVNVRRSFGDGQAVDMAMILDMIDTFHSNRQYGIALASGDSDFLMALQRIERHGGTIRVLSDPAETSKKVKEAIPHALVPIYKPHNKIRAISRQDAKAIEASKSFAMGSQKRSVITISSAKEQAIRRICMEAFNQFVVVSQATEMPVSQLAVAFQKENSWFKTKTLGFKNMRDLASSVGLFTLYKELTPGRTPIHEWYLRRKDINYGHFENGKPPVEAVIFAPG